MPDASASRCLARGTPAPADADGGRCWSPADAARAGRCQGCGGLRVGSAPGRQRHSWTWVGAGQVLSQPGPAAMPAGSHGRSRAPLRHRHRGPLCSSAGCRRVPLCGATSPCCSPRDSGDGASTSTHMAAPRATQGTPRWGVLGCWGSGAGRAAKHSPPLSEKEGSRMWPMSCPARRGPGGDSGMTQWVVLLGRADTGRGWRGQAGMKRMRRIGGDRQG